VCENRCGVIASRASRCCCVSCFNEFSQKTAAAKGPGGKKALTGFMLFSKEHRAKVKEENPDITFGGVGKKLGEMWRALSDKEKAAYKTEKA
jgi:HMG (high mobility group) box